MEGGKVFGSGSRATVAITILVKEPGPVPDIGAQLHYRDIGDYLSREEKRALRKQRREERREERKNDTTGFFDKIFGGDGDEGDEEDPTDDGWFGGEEDKTDDGQ